MLMVSQIPMLYETFYHSLSLFTVLILPILKLLSRNFLEGNGGENNEEL